MSLVEEMVQAVEVSLTAGRVEPAILAARRYFEGIEDPDAAARILGESLTILYRDMHAEAVHEFHDGFVSELSPDVAAELLKPLQPELDLTIQWKTRLDSLANERMINDITDHVKASNVSAAENLISQVVSAGETEEIRAQRAKSIGFLLGGLVHERERAMGIVKHMYRAPQRFGIDMIAAVDVEEQFQKASVAAAKRERPVGTTSRVELTQATVELSRTLPLRTAMHEPTEEDTKEFDRNVRAIMRCCLLSAGYNNFHEATLIMVEFSPKELSNAGAMAGVEQRLQGALGRTARLVATRVFTDIGQNRRLFRAYTEFSRAHLQQKIGKYCVEALGLLHNRDAVPFLLQVMADRKLDARVESIFALGAIGDERAQNVLLQGLAADLRGKVIEGQARRDAFSIISALGRIGRAMDPHSKSQVAAHTLKILPRDDMEFQVRVALNFFVGQIDGMDQKLIDWAARVGTNALWSFDRPELARAGRSATLGFRQPLIDLLERLTPFSLSTINNCAMENVKTYGAAYLAMGEFYAKAGNESCLPVLEQMVFHTLLHDDTKPKSEYLKEHILDTTSDQKVELDSDKVLSTLIYAIERIGGERGHAILADLFQRIQAGSVKAPGRETADILMQAHVRHASSQGRSAFAVPLEENMDEEPEEDHMGDSGVIDARSATSLSPADVEMLSDLEAHYILATKRRAKKVAAMAGLASRRVIPGIEPIVRHLADPDPIISAAAVTALIDYGLSNPPPRVMASLADELCVGLQKSDTNTRVKIAEVLMKIGPKRTQIRERLDAMLNVKQPLSIRSLVTKLLGDPTETGSQPAVAAVTTTPSGGTAAATDDLMDDIPPGQELVDKYMPKGKGDLTMLDKKRAYMQARQEWIRGGKRGPEPVPPK